MIRSNGFQRIILATDNSAEANAAVDATIALVRDSRSSAEVRVVHVWNLEVHRPHGHWDIEVRSEAEKLVGVMGIQQVQDVTLIRHAYVRSTSQKRGIGAHLLAHLREMANGPVLIGTWADAVWAIRFYERHGFRMVGSEEKNRLLKRYWSIPERQIETSVVLADSAWLEAERRSR